MKYAYLINKTEFCRNAFDIEASRQYNRDTFNNMIRYLNASYSSDAACSIIGAENVENAITDAFGDALKCVGGANKKSAYESMIQAEAKRQYDKGTRAVEVLDFSLN